MVEGNLETLTRTLIRETISNEFKLHKFEREILGIIAVNEEQLRKGTIKVKEHQTTSLCIIHGDCDLANMTLYKTKKSEFSSGNLWPKPMLLMM